MSSFKDLTVILVTHNSENVIKKAVSNLLDCEGISITIVDNNSKDKTIEAIESLASDKIKIIKNKQNLGFTRANNKAIKIAKTKYVLLINPDCEISKESIEKLLSKIPNHDDIAILSAEVYANETIKDKIAPVKKPSQKLLDDGIYDVKFLTGCCMLFNMKNMKKVGFFDEGFFLYCDDNELSKRILRNKLKLGVVKDTKIVHRGGQSAGDIDEKKRYAISWHRFGWSKCYYTEKVHNKFIAKLRAVRDILKCLVKILSAKIHGKTPDLVYRAKLDGAFSYLIGKKAFDKNGNPMKL